MSTIDERWNIVDTTRAFCQKVLPLVYDESLSYMEMVCKMSSKLNEVIENNNNLPQYVKELIKETVNSDDFIQIVGSVLMDTIINVKFPPEGITPAKGDGVTEDTASIQACLDYASSHGGAVVFFPSGKYLTGTLSINTETSILGADRYNTSLVLKGGGNTPLLQGVISQSIRNIHLDGNRLNQIKENYLIDGDIENALIDNVILSDSAHCITSKKCNANEFCNIKIDDIGDSIFIDAMGNNNLLNNINTAYSIIITGENNNWQSVQQTKIDSIQPLIYSKPIEINGHFGYVPARDINGNNYKLLTEGPDGLDFSVFITPQMFGAKGDGVTDDSSAFDEWLQFIVTNSKMGYIPSGVYIIAKGGLQYKGVAKNNWSIIGESKDSVILKFSLVNLNAQPNCFDIRNCDNFSISNLTINCPGANYQTSGWGFYFVNCEKYTLQNIDILNCSRGGVITYHSDYLSGGISNDCKIQNVCVFGVQNDAPFSDSDARKLYPMGFILADCKNLYMSNCYIEHVQHYGFELKNYCQNCCINACSAFECGTVCHTGGELAAGDIYGVANSVYSNINCLNCDTPIVGGASQGVFYHGIVATYTDDYVWKGNNKQYAIRLQNAKNLNINIEISNYPYGGSYVSNLKDSNILYSFVTANKNSIGRLYYLDNCENVTVTNNGPHASLRLNMSEVANCRYIDNQSGSVLDDRNITTLRKYNLYENINKNNAYQVYSAPVLTQSMESGNNVFTQYFGDISGQYIRAEYHTDGADSYIIFRLKTSEGYKDVTINKTGVVV